MLKSPQIINCPLLTPFTPWVGGVSNGQFIKQIIHLYPYHNNHCDIFLCHETILQGNFCQIFFIWAQLLSGMWGGAKLYYGLIPRFAYYNQRPFVVLKIGPMLLKLGNWAKCSESCFSQNILGCLP